MSETGMRQSMRWCDVAPGAQAEILSHIQTEGHILFEVNAAADGTHHVTCYSCGPLVHEVAP